SAGETLLPPAGSPIANTRIYILDKYDKTVPIGVWGELCIAGSSEIAGYINNDTLTDKKLLQHPELCSDNKRLYRSGDLGRWKDDGNIELKGRKDLQVKIRGFRVELGEIESKISLIENIKNCVVVVREADEGKYLVAYVVADDIDAAGINRIISGYLPLHMLPTIVMMKDIPLMPNGKVDREKLPEPELSTADNYVAPGNEIETKLVEIWSGILNMETDKIGIHNSFFELGGHSLKATIMASNIHKQFNVKVPLANIFKTPTIREIARLVHSLEKSGYEEIKPTEKREYYTISSAQKRLYVLNQIEPGSTVYNMPDIKPLEKNITPGKL
ncbi:MAG: AMP-binding protein, partial [bacterium]|nr:AMP-binding protein [bacterium]